MLTDREKAYLQAGIIVKWEELSIDRVKELIGEIEQNRFG